MLFNARQFFHLQHLLNFKKKYFKIRITIAMLFSGANLPNCSHQLFTVKLDKVNKTCVLSALRYIILVKCT